MDALLKSFSHTAHVHAAQTAVRHQGHGLTYAALDQHSTAFAAELQRRGVNAGDVVALCLDRDFNLPVALLGTLKAGATYLPLDPGYPRERLQFMLQDSAARLLVCARAHAALFSSSSSPSSLSDAHLSKDEQAQCAQWQLHDAGKPEDLSYLGDATGQNAPVMASTADSMAYLIYTSGSTGTPKGVLMPRSALATLIDWQVKEGGLHAPLTTLQFTPLSFDVHFQEFFGTWLIGGTLVLISDRERRDAIQLMRFLATEQIERLFLPFVALQQLAEVGVALAGGPVPLQHVITAGEQLRVTPALQRLFAALPGCRLHNHYGPSETHVITAHTLPDDAASWPLLPPIGRVVTGSRVYIVDEQLQPVPEGQSGELLVAGAALCAGYHARPELNAERFIHDALGESRLYRTGDLVQRNAAGELEYLGRRDGQIKVQGYRIETGEIEAAISAHTLVQDCAVIATGDRADNKQLAAYLVLDAQGLHARAAEANVSRQQSANWQQVWDNTYRDEPVHDAEFDISGWHDSYDGAQIPASQMRPWVAGIVDKLRATGARHAVEIGCGAGLIMYGYAPYCERYLATDFSPEAITKLQRNIAQRIDKWHQCAAQVMAAQDMDQLQGQAVDLVIMNSLTQHLAGGAVVEDLIVRAAQLIQDASNGAIFIGDVTNLDHRPAFFTDVALHKARPDTPLDTIRADVEKHLGQEQELVMSPAWFATLPQRVPGIQRVDISLKEGLRAGEGHIESPHNELMRFRYDVTIHLAGSTGDVTAAVQLPFALPEATAAAMTDLKTDLITETKAEAEVAAALVAQLQRVADQNAPHACITGLPNARVSVAEQQWQLVCEGQLATVADLQQAIKDQTHAAINPDVAIACAEAQGYEARAVFNPDVTRFDLMLRQPGQAWPMHSFIEGSAPPAHSLVSHPVAQAEWPALVSEVKAMLGAQLPDYMQPARYELLRAMPLTPSGKLDRRALPRVSHARPELEQEYEAPGSAMERQLAAIWAELLQIDQVGINDNFFDLGGNSLLSVKVALRIKQEIGEQFEIVSLYQYPTVASCAAFLERSAKAEQGGDGSQTSASAALQDAARQRAQQQARKQKNVFARGRRART